MADFVPRRGWSGGINNLANWRALPPGFVRDSVNVDPVPGGPMALRSGFESVYQGTNVRGALAVGPFILLADGASLVAFDTRHNSHTVLATIAGGGRFVGDVWNEELFFCTENETLRFKDGVLRPWGVTTVSYQPVPAIEAGGLLAGSYLCACTFVDAHGDEGGTTAPLLVAVEEGSGLRFQLPNPPAGGRVRLYVGSQNGGTLFMQYEGGAGSYLCSTVTDDSARLTTELQRAPVVSDIISNHNGVLLMVEGGTLWTSVPLRPHLRNLVRGFFQYPAQIDVVISSDGGLFVAADVTYFVTDLETDTPQQVQVLPHGAVRGTAVITPDNRAAWMTRYGVAKSDGQGKASLISAANFVPELADSGSSGIVERNGAQLVVTTMRGRQGQNPLVASDYYEGEIVYND